MSDSDDTRYQAMVEFLGTFSTLSGSPPEELSDLGDGVVLFEALSEIAPDYFDPTTIARHLGDNWALKASNLRKLLRNLESYYHEELEKDAEFSEINVNTIARSAHPEQISDLVELVAAAAVTCEEKGEYISRIMNMSPESQLIMKGVLQSSLARLSDFDVEEEEGDENELVFGQDESGVADDSYQEDDTPKSLFGANHLNNSNQEDLEQSLADARRELLNAKTQAAQFAEDSEKSQTKLRSVVDDLQDRLMKRQDELIQLEEDLQTTTSELDDTKTSLAEARELQSQYADDLEVANAKAQQLHKAEATVLAYKKKLEGVGVMNQHMTDLEDQAANYLRQIMDLEAEVKKSTALQKTVTELQEKCGRLEKENSDKASSTKSSVNEIAELKRELSAALNAKKVYEEELSDLRAQQENVGVDLPSDGLSLDPNNAPASAEQREKMMRLEIENKKLQEELEKMSLTETVGSSLPPVPAASVDQSADVAGLKEEVQRLRETISAKEKQNAKINSDKDKLEAYTKRTLAKFQDKYLVALQECKAKLKEKQDKIEILEGRSAAERTAQKREERLLSSTIYELGLAIMQNRLKER